MNSTERWTSLALRLNLQQNIADSLYLGLTIHYGESHRAYHNLNHIKSMLDNFDSVRRAAEAPDALEWAIWYHDVIYDPQLKNNEELSTFESNRLARAGSLPSEFAELAAGLIMATAAHDPKTPDEALIVDLDLAILGSPAAEFDAYEDNIRKEYIHVPEPNYRVGRSNVLQKFLDRPQIYSSAEFRHLEQPARSNIKRSLARLETPLST